MAYQTLCEAEDLTTMQQNPCALQCALGVHRVALDGASRSSLLLLAALCSSLCDFAELQAVACSDKRLGGLASVSGLT